MRIGADRFKLHELVRQFAKEKLQANPNEYTLILHEHSRYFASLMEVYEKKMKADVSGMSEGILKVQDDYENILAGWHHALEIPLLSEIGKYIFVVSGWCQLRGLNSEAEQTFAQGLYLFDMSKLSEHIPTRVRLMTHYGWFLLAHNQSELARLILQDALELSSVLDSSHAADIGILLGFLAVTLFDTQPDIAHERAELGLRNCQVIDFQLGVWMCLTFLGEIERIEERHESAFHYHHQALMNAEQHRNLFGITQSLAHLGCACYALGQVDDGLAYLRRCLSFMNTFVDVDNIFLLIFGIAGIHELRGRPEVALELLAILVFHPQYGSPVLGPTVHLLLAQLQSRLSSAQINSVMEKAKQGQLSSRYLDPHFTVSLELVDRLSKLLDEAARV